MTHDQGEAMVISDRIAVLEKGRVVQVGTAEELFQHPRTRFVAEFIGKTNLVDSLASEPAVVTRGSLRLHVASSSLIPGVPVTVSIRPHQIELAADHAGPSPPGRGENRLRGRVQRVSYLGDAVDYQVQVEGSDVILRVAAPPLLRFQPGESVSLAVAPAACIPLTEGNT